MAPSRQLTLGPMGAISGGNAIPTAPTAVGTAPLVDLAFRAFVACGKTQQEAAGLLDTSKSNFSKAFSVNWPDDNPFMKRWDGLPFEIRREFARLLMVDYDLSAPDHHQTRVLRDFAHLIVKAVNE